MRQKREIRNGWWCMMDTGENEENADNDFTFFNSIFFCSSNFPVWRLGDNSTQPSFATAAWLANEKWTVVKNSGWVVTYGHMNSRRIGLNYHPKMAWMLVLKQKEVFFSITQRISHNLKFCVYIESMKMTMPTQLESFKQCCLLPEHFIIHKCKKTEEDSDI